MGTPYSLRTERTVVRCWHPLDARLLKAAVDANLDHLRPWMPWAKHEPTDLAAKVSFLRHCRGTFDLDQDYTFGIFDEGETRVLGGCGLHDRVGSGALEIGYWIHHQWLGQGYATEVAGALTRTAFDFHGVRRVEIRCDGRNQASARIAEKLGYQLEATRWAVDYDCADKPRHTMIWVMHRSMVEESPVDSLIVEARDSAGEVMHPPRETGSSGAPEPDRARTALPAGGS